MVHKERGEIMARFYRFGSMFFTVVFAVALSLATLDIAQGVKADPGCGACGGCNSGMVGQNCTTLFTCTLATACTSCVCQEYEDKPEHYT
jgi:hypothetical protein